MATCDGSVKMVEILACIRNSNKLSGLRKIFKVTNARLFSLIRVMVGSLCAMGERVYGGRMSCVDGSRVNRSYAGERRLGQISSDRTNHLTNGDV